MRSCLLALTLALAVSSCAEEKKPEVADAGDDGGAQKVAPGGRLGRAFASAAAASPSASPGEQQPPETGIFAPGLADKAHPAGAPPALVLASEGNPPKVPLSYDPLKKHKLEVQFQLRMGRGGIPTIAATIEVGPRGDASDDKGAEGEKKDDAKKDDAKKGEAKKDDAKKDDAKKDDAKKDDAPAEPALAAWPAPKAGEVDLVARFTKLELVGQKAQKEVTDALDKMRGATVEVRTNKLGLVVGPRVSLPAGAQPGLGLAVKAIGEGILLLSPGLPDKPVGVGAQWMITDRAASASSGVEVVRYRAYRFEKMNKGAAVISLTTRQYAADAKIEADTGEGKLTQLPIVAFASAGQGRLSLGSGGPLTFFPAAGELVQKLQANVQVGKQVSPVSQDLVVRIGDQLLDDEAQDPPQMP